MKASRTIIGSVFAFVLATSCCWLPWLAIALGSATGLAGLTDGLEKYSGIFMTLGVLLLGLGIFQWKKQRNFKMKEIMPILQSTITCPVCGHQKTEVMPEDACQYFYECSNCNNILKPINNDCCVYCSYGTVPCPPIQMNQNCCD